MYMNNINNVNNYVQEKKNYKVIIYINNFL